MLHPEWIAKVAFAFDKQFHLSDLVGSANWRLDSASGVLSFGTRDCWQTQLLGIQTRDNWRWAWADSSTSTLGGLLAASHQVRMYGEQHAIAELTQPEVALTQTDGHSLSLLASGICKANAYYRCPYEGEALFVLITDENYPKCTDPPLRRVLSIFPQVLASLDIADHRLALGGYLAEYGLRYEQDEHQLVVREAGRPVLTATFDVKNRLTSLEAEFNPGAVTSGETWEEGQVRRMLGM